jgi:phage FluMu protein Com
MSMPTKIIKQVSRENGDAGKFALDVGNNYIIPMQELHCPGCKRFLGYQAIAWGAIKLKCPNCKEWVTMDVSPE